MSELQRKLAKAVLIARGIWMLVMLGSFAFAAFFLPSIYLLLLIPFAILSYLMMLIIVGFTMSGQINEEVKKEFEEQNKIKELTEKIATGNHSPDEVMKMMHEVGITDAAVVEETSKVIGTYNGHEIFEWIYVKSPNMDKPAKFMYYGPAEVSNGMSIIPVVPGLLFACVQGVLYYIEVEPAQKDVQTPIPKV